MFRTLLCVALGLSLALMPGLSGGAAWAADDPPYNLAAQLAAAAPGATLRVPAGRYHGDLIIDKPLTLIAEPGAVIEGDGQGTVVTVTAPDVTLQGFTIRNSGESLDREDAGITGMAPRLHILDNHIEDTLFGIYLQNAPHSVVRGNTVRAKSLDVARLGDGIRVWYSDSPLVEDNHVIGSRDLVVWFSPHAVVRGNLIEQSRYGLHFMFADDQLVENNILVNNSVGIYVMYGVGLTLRHNLIHDHHGPSGIGLGIKDADNVVIEHNSLVGNRMGVYVDGSPREPNAFVHFRHNLVAHNEIGITMLPLVQRVVVAENTFEDNGEQVAVAGGGTLMHNVWAENGRGNYWSDYAGYDADRDRVGDIPYISAAFYESLLGEYPELRLFQLSPAVQALDLAARAFPIFQPQAKLTDPHPLTVPPAASWPRPTATPSTATTFWLALALLVIGLAVIVGGWQPWRNYR